MADKKPVPADPDPMFHPGKPKPNYSPPPAPPDPPSPPKPPEPIE